MGLSASQARFLQLTARKSNVEYEAQQISFERLQLSQTLSDATNEYEDATSNRKLIFTFNDGTGSVNVDLSYQNYKTYMNQQGTSSIADTQYYLVSSSGNKIIAGSEEDMQTIIANSTYYTTNDDGETVENYKFTSSDFLIVDDLDDVDLFQQAIKDGTYYFATLGEDDNGNNEFTIKSYETLGDGAITEVYDESDDAAAEASWESTQSKIQTADKKLELRLDQLESERSAIETEIDSVSKVIEDNIEQSFQVFS